MCFDSKLYKKYDNTTELQNQNITVPGEASRNTLCDIKPYIFTTWTKDINLLEAVA